MTYNLYNVYKEGDLVVGGVKSGEAAAFIGCPSNRISGYAHTGDRIYGIYKIEIAERVCEVSGDLTRAFIQRFGMENYKIWKHLNWRYGARFRFRA